MKPVFFQMSTMDTFIWLEGTSTLRRRAFVAFRTRVSKSPIGSVIMSGTHQLALITPGIIPCSANFLKQMRHSANLRRYARERPHRGHRLYFRTLNFGFRVALTLNE